MKTMRWMILAALAAASACSKAPEYVEFRETGGRFTAQVPARWVRDGQEDLSRKPSAFMSWVGEVAAEKEGRQVGAIIHVNRFERKLPSANFKKQIIDPTDAMFGTGALPADAPKNIESLKVAGFAARKYRRDFETTLGGGMHGTAGPFPMRLEDVVIQTPEAYYVLEYRATQALFDKHYNDFKKFAETFALK